MNRMISIPRDALAELLRLTGSELTPEQYVASLPGVTATDCYAGRIKASNWSKIILAVAAGLSVLILPFDFDVESLIITAGIGAVTYYEFRVNRYFREGDLSAPSLGFRNQAFFAAALLIYGLYHALFPSAVEVPAEYRELIDATTLASMQSTMRVGYLAIGIVGGISQFCLAWYYRNAQVRGN